MHRTKQILSACVLIALLGGQAAEGQDINLWQGNGTAGEWSDPYKWKLQHVPKGDESVHFRKDHSVVSVNSTVELHNGMLLFGRDLYLEGSGNINLRNAVPHRSTVNIPASASGSANLTLSDSLSLSGRIALAAKVFATADNQGSVTLKDRSIVMGGLLIGNNGNGTGQVYIEDRAIFRISSLELHTEASKGGHAEIHINGGTAQLDNGVEAANALNADPGRRIIIGENGVLKLNFNLSPEDRENAIAGLLAEQSITATEDYRLGAPQVSGNMVIIQAVHIDSPEALAEAAAEAAAAPPPEPVEVEEPVAEPQVAVAVEPVPTVQVPAAKPASAKPSRLEALLQDQREKTQEVVVASVDTTPEPDAATSAADDNKSESIPVAGYIVFFSAFLFLIRPQARD